MKHTIHTPTEQFGFVETEFEHDDVLASENISAEHKLVVEAAKPKTGLPSKEFNVSKKRRDDMSTVEGLWKIVL